MATRRQGPKRFEHAGVLLEVWDNGEFDLTVRNVTTHGETAFDVTDRQRTEGSSGTQLHEIAIWRHGGLVTKEHGFVVSR
jgi:hypothetical protein